MIDLTSKDQRRRARHERARQRLRGSAAQPRLSVFRSLQHIYVQLIDDDSGRVLLAASSRAAKDAAAAPGGNVAAARALGQKIATAARAKGIERVVFDRGGYEYHGRIKALAEAAREAGLRF